MRDFGLKDLNLVAYEKVCLCPLTGLLWIYSVWGVKHAYIVGATSVYKFLGDLYEFRYEGTNASGWAHIPSLVYGGRYLDDLELRAIGPEKLNYMDEEDIVPCPTALPEES